MRVLRQVTPLTQWKRAISDGFASGIVVAELFRRIATAMGSRILIVDDDPATRLGVCELLKRAGHDAIGSGTFEEARRAIREALSLNPWDADVRRIAERMGK